MKPAPDVAMHVGQNTLWLRTSSRRRSSSETLSYTKSTTGRSTSRQGSTTSQTSRENDQLIALTNNTRGREPRPGSDVDTPAPVNVFHLVNFYFVSVQSNMLCQASTHIQYVYNVDKHAPHNQETPQNKQNLRPHRITTTSFEMCIKVSTK